MDARGASSLELVHRPDSARPTGSAAWARTVGCALLGWLVAWGGGVQTLAQSPERLVTSGTEKAASSIPLGKPCLVMQAEAARLPIASRRVELSSTVAQVAPIGATVAVDPTGQRIAVGGDDHTIRIVDLKSGQETDCLQGHIDWVRTLEWDRSGKHLFSSGNDGRVLMWDMDAPQDPRVIAVLPTSIFKITLHPGGELLATIGFGAEVHLMDIVAGRVRDRWVTGDGDLRAAAFDQSGRWLAVGGRSGRIEIWDCQTGARLAQQQVHERRIRAIRFSPQGRTLWSVGEDGRIGAWDWNSPHPPWRSDRVAAKLLCIEALGSNLIAVGGTDNAVHLFDLANRHTIGRLQGHLGSVTGVRAIGDQLISSGFDATLYVWDGVSNTPPLDRLWGRPVSSIETQDAPDTTIR
ncbi:MAG: hypothetical protein D6753_06550 [Planctomycetota bacterium]|nr:MAG: hypothetical protein D6753_06550 [Planctomycetota bacterium]